MAAPLKENLSDQQFIRYSRQLMLPRFGEKGQLALQRAKCAIIGVGGLGQQVAQLLAAAGVGKLLLIDPDVIALDNLPRQLLYTGEDIGQPKVQVAFSRLAERYPDSDTEIREIAFDDTQHHQLAGCDLILDCSDNFACRHSVNRAAVTLNIPLVSGAISADTGLLSLFHPAEADTSGCYHCLFPDSVRSTQNCSSMGVLGPAVAVIASLQAQWALNYLNGERNNAGSLIRFDAASLTFSQATLRRDPECPVCGTLNKELSS